MIYEIENQGDWYSFLANCREGHILLVSIQDQSYDGITSFLKAYSENCNPNLIRFVVIRSKQKDWEWAVVNSLPTFRLLRVTHRDTRTIEEWFDTDLDMLKERVQNLMI